MLYIYTHVHEQTHARTYGKYISHTQANIHAFKNTRRSGLTLSVKIAFKVYFLSVAELNFYNVQMIEFSQTLNERRKNALIVVQEGHSDLPPL